MSLWVSSSRGGEGRLAGLAVAERGEQDVGAAAGEADEGGVVRLTFGAFAGVVGPARGVGQAGERGEEQRAFEVLLPPRGEVFAAGCWTGAVGDWCQAGVGGEVSGCAEGRSVADFEQHACGGPDREAGHRGQDPGKRVRIEHPLDLGGDVFALLEGVRREVASRGSTDSAAELPGTDTLCSRSPR